MRKFSALALSLGLMAGTAWAEEKKDEAEKPAPEAEKKTEPKKMGKAAGVTIKRATQVRGGVQPMQPMQKGDAQDIATCPGCESAETDARDHAAKTQGAAMAKCPDCGKCFYCDKEGTVIPCACEKCCEMKVAGGKDAACEDCKARFENRKMSAPGGKPTKKVEETPTEKVK